MYENPPAPGVYHRYEILDPCHDYAVGIFIFLGDIFLDISPNTLVGIFLGVFLAV